MSRNILLQIRQFWSQNTYFGSKMPILSPKCLFWLQNAQNVPELIPKIQNIHIFIKSIRKYARRALGSSPRHPNQTSSRHTHNPNKKRKHRFTHVTLYRARKLHQVAHSPIARMLRIPRIGDTVMFMTGPGSGLTEWHIVVDITVCVCVYANVYRSKGMIFSFFFSPSFCFVHLFVLALFENMFHVSCTIYERNWQRILCRISDNFFFTFSSDTYLSASMMSLFSWS